MERQSNNFDQGEFKNLSPELQALLGRIGAQRAQLQAEPILSNEVLESIATLKKITAQYEMTDEETPEEESTKEPMLKIGAHEVIESPSSYHEAGFSEDYVLKTFDKGIIGVFDGAGGSAKGGGDPAAAARLAATAAYDVLRSTQVTNEADLRELLTDALDEANEAVYRGAKGGYAVGTFAKLAQFEDGNTYLGVAHAGDTQAYLVRRDDNGTLMYRPLVPEQAEGRYIYNGIGITAHKGYEDFIGVFELHDGDMLMLCSDGITGDTPEQHLTDDEYMLGFAQPTPKAMAECFHHISRKDDDKSIVTLQLAA